MIRLGVSNSRATGNPLIFIPLHKGADGFLSDQQFQKFYWPTLKQVMLGLIDEGTREATAHASKSSRTCRRARPCG